MEWDLRSVWLTHFIIYISIRRFWYNHYSNHMIFFCESTIPTHLNWASNPESFGFIWRLWASIFCLSEYIFWGHFEISICPDIAMGHIYGQGGGWLAGLATLVVTRAILCWTQDSHALIFRCHLFTSRKASGLVGKIFHILFLLRESVSLTQILSSLWPKINWHHGLLYDSRVHLKLGMWARSKSISDCFDSLVSAGGSLWYARQAETLCQEPQECPPLRHWGPSYWAIEPSNHHLME